MSARRRLSALPSFIKYCEFEHELVLRVPAPGLMAPSLGLAGRFSTPRRPPIAIAGTYPYESTATSALVLILASFGAMSRAGRVAAPGRRDPLALLKLVKDIPSDTFPALKRSAASALSIIEEVADSVTTAIQSLGSDDRPVKLDVHRIRNVRELEKVATLIPVLRQAMPAGRIRSGRKDREAIANMKTGVQAALNHFNCGPTSTPADTADLKQFLAHIIERYKEDSISEVSNTTRAAVQDSPTSEDNEPFQSASLVFNTSATSGGTVINVARDYNTHDGQSGQRHLEHANGVSSQLKPKTSALERLPYAEGASWSTTLGCLPGTRVATLSLILDWSRSRDQHNILLLKGVAGSGKSAISHAIAKVLQDCGLLTSCFFFDRESNSRNTPRLLFSTIARDIAALYSAIAADISDSLEKEPALASADVSRQFEAFIAGPLRRHPIDRQIVVVIDGLDEAVSDDGDTDLLPILRDEITKLPNFRLFLTSRPMRNIERFLSASDYVSFLLLDIDSSENHQDIAIFVDVMVRDVAISSQMGTPWPDEGLIHDLKIMAEGLFIWIATVFAYLRSSHKPRAKLRALLSKSLPPGPHEPTKKIDALYATILEDCGDWDDPEFCEDYAIFMGAITAVKRPLSLAALRSLHGENQELLLDRLPQRFGSVLVGLYNEHEPIHTLHLSFREFVTARAAERADTRKFFLSEKDYSCQLAELCLRTIVRELTAAPVTGTGYLARDEDDEPGIPKLAGVSEQLLYGCESWGDHVCDIESPTVAVVKIMRDFLPYHCTTAIEIVASTSSFKGSLSVWRWLKNYGIELSELYDDALQAKTLFALSSRLGYAGRLEEALAAIDDSVHLRRALATHQPDAFNAKLARSLNNLSTCLSKLGQREEALTVIQEAVSLCRTLAAERPQAINADLASSLGNLSKFLSDLGQREEALMVIQETMGLHRSLAVERPQAFNADLAASLNNLSRSLSELGQREEALTATQEAVSLHRTLAAERPQIFNTDLAASLSDLSTYLSELGQREEALTVIQEAVRLHRTLAAERPQVFNADLAQSLHNLSNCLSNLGRREEALTVIQEAVSMRRTLAAERPQAFNTDLAQSLYNLSLRLSGLGWHEEVLLAGEEAASLYRALATERPAVHTSGVLIVLEWLAECLSANGRAEEAQVISREANSYRYSV
ncbi:hypothetical protein HWV62_33607 [Athelia sp. TMB]|nr:hypothetical protein HWV62_33607 [Athelia sp. TMB]